MLVALSKNHHSSIISPSNRVKIYSRIWVGSHRTNSLEVINNRNNKCKVAKVNFKRKIKTTRRNRLRLNKIIQALVVLALKVDSIKVHFSSYLKVSTRIKAIHLEEILLITALANNHKVKDLICSIRQNR